MTLTRVSTGRWGGWTTATLALALIACASWVTRASTDSAASVSRVVKPRVRAVSALTADRGGYVRPAWSTDGQWVGVGRAGMAGIEIIRREGTESKTLTVDPGSGYKFAWSPDSSEIAYRGTLAGTNAGSYVIKSVEVATGRVKELSTPGTEVRPPTWFRSNENQRVSFMVGTNRINTPWARLKVKAVLRASVRSDETLLYSDQGQLWSCGAGNTCAQLTETGGMEPVWSPDRSKIVYSQMGTLMIMEPDGSKKRPLAQGHHPSWSPDGRMLVYDVSLDDGHRILSSDLYVIAAGGTQPTQLTDTPAVLECEPAWSPDGKCIACRTEDSGRVLLLWLE